MRLDKFTWSVRLYKTRTLAAKACAGEKIQLNGAFTKASKVVAIGDEFAVKELPIWRRFKVLALPKSRVGNRLVVDFIVETTSMDDLSQLTHYQLVSIQNKSLGIKGRPTKDRRTLDQLNRKA